MKTKKKIIKSSPGRVAVHKKKKGSEKKKSVKTAALMRSKENPIISPKPENFWEAWQTFNPGVVLLDGKVYFLYRAIGRDGFSRFGYAASGDGFIIDERLSYPVYEHKIKQTVSPFTFYSPTPLDVYHLMGFASGGSFGGAEDPRLVRVGKEDKLYMTYTACDEGLRVALTSIKVKDFLQKKWKWQSPKLISPPGEVHKNWVLFPEKIQGRYAILHSINPEISIAYMDDLEFKDKTYIDSYYDSRGERNRWDSYMRGAGPPPIKTQYGWLLLYQAMNKNDMSKYKVGAMLLDLEDPTKILHRSPYPILEPEEVYENNGFKAGVVYASGAVAKDGNLLVYYGAADSFIGVAYADFEEFLQALLKETKPKLRRKVIRQKP